MFSLTSGLDNTIQELAQKRHEFLKTADILTYDPAANSAVELRFQDAVQLYGQYATPLIARLGRGKAIATTHYWLEMAVRAGLSGGTNAQLEGGTPATRSSTPVRLSNTCQICSGKVDVSGSAIQEAANGLYGSNVTDLVEFQANAELQGIMKDIEIAALLGTEMAGEAATARKMSGLVNWIDSTTKINAGTNALAATYFDETFATIMESKVGFVPNAIYAPARACIEIASWNTDKIQFNVNIPDLAALRNLRLTAGQAIGWYMSQWGPLEIIVHPELTVATAEASLYLNRILLICEPLVKLADFRPLHMKPWVTTEDAVQRAIIWEGTLEAKVDTAHAMIYNWKIT
jgi:hypothetical protein